MKRGAIVAVYVVSVLGHAAMGAAVSAIELPPPPPERIEVALRASTPPPPPEAAPPEPAPPMVAEARAPAPTPKPRQRHATPPAPMPTEAARPAPPSPPVFGVTMSNSGSGPGGIAVPVGDPGGDREAPRTRVREAQRLHAAPTRDSAEEQASCPGETRRPRPLAMPHPRYTDAARAASIEGRVRVEITVGLGGEVENARVLSPLGYGLDEAALDSARSARFEAALDCGRAVPATFVVSIRFTQ